MLVNNYGLFWRREHVFWGRGRNAGHLKGVKASAKSGNAVDFRDQQGIYCLYDDNFRLVYVGQAGGGKTQRLWDRLKQHTTDALADRWSKFSWFGIRSVNKTGLLRVEKAAAHPPLNDVLNHIEAILIAASEPPHNRQGGRFGDATDQYLQHYDKENLGPEVTSMIRDLWDKLQNG